MKKISTPVGILFISADKFIDLDLELDRFLLKK